MDRHSSLEPMVDLSRAPQAARPYLRDAVATLLLGVLVALTTGVVPNQPDVSIVGAQYYGVPLPWRIELPEMGRREFVPRNLLVDVLVFWVGAAVALPVARRARDWVDERDSGAESDPGDGNGLDGDAE
jgi:hypothetical protein